MSSPRQAIKQVFQSGLIDDGHIWMEALEKRNLTVHTYDENRASEFIKEILTFYLPAIKALYNRLLEEY